MLAINAKYEYWKNRLLDLGKRNRLINCLLPKDGKRIQRHSLIISEPTPNELWSLLHDKNKSLTFPMPQNPEDENIITNLFDLCNDIKTNQVSDETYKTLRSLMKKANDFQQEKGLNALHLAFGFLNWADNGTDGQQMRSPLLLLPVKLEQEDLFSPILLSESDEEIIINHSLNQRLFNDFGIELPTLTEDMSAYEYLRNVESTVASLGWNVSKDITQLSLFSFMKINMYRDLELNEEKICNHPVIRAINGEIQDDGIDISDIINYNHDNTNPQEVYSVVDADSSQQDAILLAKRGVSFILQGPPGTGKSQTITNIIAELITSGKKVLFVSEKTAALEVVYKRLTQVGLAPFCLSLHSHNAKRREVIEQFNQSIQMSRQKVTLQQNAYTQLLSLVEERKKLNQYSTELHTIIEPLGKTIYQVNGYLAQYEDYSNIDYVQKDIDKFTPDLFAQSITALEELTRIVLKSGYQVHNPWNGCVMTESPTFEFRQRFLVDSEALINKLQNGITIFNELNMIFGISVSWKPEDVIIIQEINNHVKSSPKVNPAWLSEDFFEISNVIESCIDLVNAKRTLQADFNMFKRESIVVKSCIEENKKVVYDEKVILPDAVAAYHNALEAYINISEQDKYYEDLLSTLDKKYTLCEEKCNDERARFEVSEREWQSACDSLFTKCTENFLTLDIPMILAHYRSGFRSALRRLSGDYRQNRMAILSYCKTPGKISYEQQLALLEEADNALRLKSIYENQFDTLKGIENEYNSLKVELDDLRLKFDENKNLQSTSSTTLEKQKNEVLSAAAELASDYRLKLNSLCQEFNDNCQKLSDTLGENYSDTTDYVQLKEKMLWCKNFSELIKQHSFGLRFINGCCDANIEIQNDVKRILTQLQEWQNNITPDYDKFLSLFTYTAEANIKALSVEETASFVKSCKDNFESLEYLIDYRIAEKRLKELGIDIFLNKAIENNLAAKDIIPVFEKCFYRSWLDVYVAKHPAVRDFRRLRQEERITRFRELDETHLEISKATIISKLISRLPNFDIFSAKGEIRLLRREMAKQRRLMPTRLLIAALPNLLPVLKPCIMMSPLSVSTYLGSSNYEFDTVIFDEASQIRTEDAIGAIFRAKQAIIAGDSKQLPPTDFFNSSISTTDEYEEDEDGIIDDTGAYESLLDEATMLPAQTLLWHYRSRHEHLIAFSNAKIYQGNLITFPSSVEKTEGMGVEHVFVENGIYNRGLRGEGGNRIEAKRIAELVFEHFRSYPERSIGIIAFGVVQQTAIEEAIETMRRANYPTFESFFTDDIEEPLFIKNLETVQGDERDTILFSVGYAPDIIGKFIMNFGPLSREGGERRLNVAVTRARYNLKLVSSIMPTDIDVERISGQGPKLLRSYIDFAVNGVNSIYGEISEEQGIWFDSPFEESVYNYLAANDYDVATQVGCSGYRIDMAIRHPKYPGRFALGIECDGAMYHSARTARERDRLRQTILEEMGWQIYRIWSTNWIKDRNTEGARLLNAVKSAISSYREFAPKPENPTAKMTDFLEISTQTEYESMREGVSQKHVALRSSYYKQQAKDVPSSDIAKVMRKVLDNNHGLNRAELFKETALYGYGWERQGSTIKEKFQSVYKKLVTQGIVEEYEDGKIILKNPEQNIVIKYISKNNISEQRRNRVEFSLSVENKGTKDIKQVQYDVDIQDRSGTFIMRLTCNLTGKTIKAGETVIVNGQGFSFYMHEQEKKDYLARVYNANFEDLVFANIKIYQIG